MHLKTSTFDVEVKYKPAGNELLIQEPQIRMKTMDGKIVQKVRVVAKNTFQWKGKNLAVDIKLIDPETQQEVTLSEALEILDNYKYKYLAEDGSELKEEEIVYFAVQPDGTEKEVSPYSRTDVIEIPEENWVPSTSIEAFLITNVYEIYSEDKKTAIRLFEEAEKRLKADQIGIATFSFGGFKAYYVFLCPMFKDGKFVWLHACMLSKLGIPPSKYRFDVDKLKAKHEFFKTRRVEGNFLLDEGRLEDLINSEPKLGYRRDMVYDIPTRAI